MQANMSVDLVKAAMKQRREKKEEGFTPLNVETSFVLSTNAESWMLRHPGVHRSYAAICDVVPLWDASKRAIVFPIYHEGRIVDGTSRSTVLKRWEKLARTGLPYSTQRGGTALIVEDPVSAYFNPNVFSGVSLNGTALTGVGKAFIGKNYQRAIIALDRDIAPRVMSQMARDLGEFIPTRIAHLHKDLKWYSEDEAAEFTRQHKEWIIGVDTYA